MLPVTPGVTPPRFRTKMKKETTSTRTVVVEVEEMDVVVESAEVVVVLVESELVVLSTFTLSKVEVDRLTLDVETVFTEVVLVDVDV